MVWLVDKKIFHHVFDLGFERVKIPIRVKFEFEVKDGSLVSDSISIQQLYNRQALEKRYPSLNPGLLDSAIDKTVKEEINKYLLKSGYLKDDNAF
jgi:hypothetical protein